MTDKVLIDRSVLEQEPVAFMYEYAEGWTTQLRFDGSKPLQVIPLYTHPQPKREPLSDEEVKAICYTGPVYAPDGKVTRTPEQYKREIADARMHGIRQAERAHGIVGE